MLPSEQVLTDLIGSMYDAAVEPALWKPFLEQIARTARADASGLVMHDDKQDAHAIAASWEVDPEMLRQYREYYGPLDLWTERGKGKPAGYVCASQELCAVEELKRTEVYNDLMVRFNIEHGMFGLVQRDGYGWSTLSLYRSVSSGEFGASDLDILYFLIPHMQRAFRLHFQFSELRARSEGIEKALNMLTTGVIFLGAKGEVLLMNSAAEQILNSRDGLLLAHGKLGAAVYGESTRIQAMIGAAVKTGSGSGLSAGGTLLISRRKGRPISVTVAPLHEFSASFSHQPVAVLFISDPDRNPELPVDLLQRCYGLTPAEARLALVLLEGHSLKAAADSCGVTHNTAKSQLKSVFLKTEVQRQGELIRLLLNTAGVSYASRARTI